MNPIYTQSEIKRQISGMLNIENLPEQERDNIIDELSDIIEERIVLAFMSRIPEEELKRAEMLADSGQIEQLSTLISQYVENPVELANSVIESAVQEFKNNVKEAQNQNMESDFGAQTATSSFAVSDFGQANNMQHENKVDENELEKLIDEFEKELQNLENLSDTTQSEPVVFEQSSLDNQGHMQQIRSMETADSMSKDVSSQYLQQNTQNLSNQGENDFDPIEAAKQAANNPPSVSDLDDADYENFVVTDDGVAKPADDDYLINPDVK